jgi:hypothetical protein
MISGSCWRSDGSDTSICTDPTIPPQYGNTFCFLWNSKVTLNNSFTDFTTLSPRINSKATTALKFGTPSAVSVTFVCIGLGLSPLFTLATMVLTFQIESMDDEEPTASIFESRWMEVIGVIGILAAGLRMFLTFWPANNRSFSLCSPHSPSPCIFGI